MREHKGGRGHQRSVPGAARAEKGASDEKGVTGGWHGRRGRLDGGMSRRGRFFDHGELRHVVLALLGEQPRHGYDIIRAIETRTGGAYCPSPGVIYPTLQLLEDAGHVAPAPGGETRNSYQITAQGREFLEENGALVDDIMARMKRFGRSHASTFPVFVAAMDSLKSALRSGEEPWTEAEARDAAAAIDEAAERIRTLRDSYGKEPKK